MPNVPEALFPRMECLLQSKVTFGAVMLKHIESLNIRLLVRLIDAFRNPQVIPGLELSSVKGA